MLCCLCGIPILLILYVCSYGTWVSCAHICTRKWPYSRQNRIPIFVLCVCIWVWYICIIRPHLHTYVDMLSSKSFWSRHLLCLHWCFRGWKEMESNRSLIVTSHKVSKPQDLYSELSDCSEIWQAPRQHHCHILKRYNDLNNQSRGFETARDIETEPWWRRGGCLDQMILLCDCMHL